MAQMSLPQRHAEPSLRNHQDEVEQRYHETINLKNRIRSSEYKVTLVWECKNQVLSNSKSGKKFIPYPHFIIYDFEALLRPRNWCKTQGITIDCSHIPVSVAINDSLTQEPIFIENSDPELLVSEFVT